MSYYVYELIDPRDDRVFYVGKGKKGRIDQHEAEARKRRSLAWVIEVASRYNVSFAEGAC